MRVFEAYWIHALFGCRAVTNLFPTETSCLQLPREYRTQLHRVETDYKVSRHNSDLSSHWRPPTNGDFR